MLLSERKHNKTRITARRFSDRIPLSWITHIPKSHFFTKSKNIFQKIQYSAFFHENFILNKIVLYILSVLKSNKNHEYIINGDYSGLYEAAGTMFDYRRIDDNRQKKEGVTEWITCTGPTTEPVNLMVSLRFIITFHHHFNRKIINKNEM